MLKSEKHRREEKEKEESNSSGALEFVLPASSNIAEVFFPDGAVAASASEWHCHLLAGITEIKDKIERLTISDYKTVLSLLKDILISHVNDVLPNLSDVKTLYLKALDAYHKLDDQNVEEKVELIKIQMFCTVYTNCYDEKSCTIIKYKKLEKSRKGIIREGLSERLKELQKLSERNRVEYNSEQSGKKKYQKMLTAINHIKKINYCHIITKDIIYQVNDFTVMVWSLHSYMVPKGETGALFSSTHSFGRLTIQASIYKDKESTWFLNVNLISYSDVSVICKFQSENREAAIFLPCKLDRKSWTIDTSFLSNQKGIISFYIFKRGNANVHIPLDIADNEESDDFLLPCGTRQVEVMKNGFGSSRAILEIQDHSVVTVVGFMNLTSSTIQLSPPAMTSGCASVRYPWPKEVPPLTLVNLVSHKTMYSARGCVGATLIRLSPALHILIWWQTPFDKKLSKNCFGIGLYSGDNFGYCGDLLDKISNLPDKPPSDTTFHLHLAKDGPVSINLSNNWRLSINMTADHKAVLDVILHNEESTFQSKKKLINDVSSPVHDSYEPTVPSTPFTKGEKEELTADIMLDQQLSDNSYQNQADPLYKKDPPTGLPPPYTSNNYSSTSTTLHQASARDLHTGGRKTEKEENMSDIYSSLRKMMLDQNPDDILNQDQADLNCKKEPSAGPPYTSNNDSFASLTSAPNLNPKDLSCSIHDSAKPNCNDAFRDGPPPPYSSNIDSTASQTNRKKAAEAQKTENNDLLIDFDICTQSVDSSNPFAGSLGPPLHPIRKDRKIEKEENMSDIYSSLRKVMLDQNHNDIVNQDQADLNCKKEPSAGPPYTSNNDSYALLTIKPTSAPNLNLEAKKEDRLKAIPNYKRDFPEGAPPPYTSNIDSTASPTNRQKADEAEKTENKTNLNDFDICDQSVDSINPFVGSLDPSLRPILSGAMPFPYQPHNPMAAGYTSIASQYPSTYLYPRQALAYPLQGYAPTAPNEDYHQQLYAQRHPVHHGYSFATAQGPAYASHPQFGYTQGGIPQGYAPPQGAPQVYPLQYDPAQAYLAFPQHPQWR